MKRLVAAAAIVVVTCGAGCALECSLLGVPTYFDSCEDAQSHVNDANWTEQQRLELEACLVEKCGGALDGGAE